MKTFFHRFHAPTYIVVAVLLTVFVGCTQSRSSKEQFVVPNTDKSESSNIENMEQVYHFLRDCGTYYLATVDGDQPRVRPFGTVNIFENKLYIQTGKVKNVAHQIKANPKVEICAFNGSEWIRVAATLVEDDRREARASMLDAYPELRSMYSEDDGNTIVYYLKDATATISSFSAPAQTITF